MAQVKQKTSRIVSPKPKENRKPRTKPSEVRRQDLMDAASRLFLKKGITATSIDDVVSVADVSKGTFYLYFTSKDDIVSALREAYTSRFYDQLEAAASNCRPDDWRGRLTGLAAASVNAYLEDYDLHQVLFHSGGHYTADNESRTNARLLQLHIDILKNGTKAGAWQVRDPEMTAVLIYNAVHGALDHVMVASKTPNKKAITRSIQEFMLKLVGL